MYYDDVKYSLSRIFYLVAGGSNEQSVDGVSTSENLLDIGPSAAIENGGVVGNLWACPIPPPSINQGQPGKVSP